MGADARSVVAAGAHRARRVVRVPDLKLAHVRIGVLGNRHVLVGKASQQPGRLSAVLNTRVIEYVNHLRVVDIEADPLAIVRVGALVGVGGHDNDLPVEEVRHLSHDIVTVTVVRVADAEVAG